MQSTSVDKKIENPFWIVLMLIKTFILSYCIFTTYEHFKVCGVFQLFRIFVG